MAALNVVQSAIVALGHDRCERVIRDTDLRILCDHPAHDAVRHAWDIERVREGDGIFKEARLRDPCEAGHFSGAVQHKRAGGHLLMPGILAGNHNGHACADWALAWLKRSLALDEGRVADFHTGHVGNRIQRARLRLSDHDAKIS